MTELQHSALATFVLPIAQALRLRGVDAMALVEQAGVDPASIVNPDRRVAPERMQRLFRACVEATGDEAFGLVAAEQIQPQVLSGLGLAWLASDTLLDGLQRLVRFARIMSSGVELALEDDGALVHLVIGPRVEDERFTWAVRDFAVGLVVRMCRLTLGEFIAPLRVEMERPRPAEPERWEYLLSCRVAFDRPEARVTFLRADIVERLATGDPELARINDEQAQAYLDSIGDSGITRQVADRIVATLPDGAPSQQQIAASLNLSNRTLQRRLRDEGTSFLDLLQDTRLQLAHKYLRQRKRSVVETAYMLGFSEPSTFSRAFKRWTGMAPAAYRERAGEE